MVVIEMFVSDGRSMYGAGMTTVSIPVSRRDEFGLHCLCESNWLYEEISRR